MRTRRKQRKARKSRRLRFESLESRDLLAAVWHGGDDAGPTTFQVPENWALDTPPSENEDATFNEDIFGVNSTVDIIAGAPITRDFNIEKGTLTVNILTDLSSGNINLGATADVTATVKGLDGMAGSDTWTFDMMGVGVAKASTLTLTGGIKARSTIGGAGVVGIGNLALGAELIIDDATLDLSAGGGAANGQLNGNSGRMQISSGNLVTGRVTLGLGGVFTATLDDGSKGTTWENTEDFLVGQVEAATLDIESTAGNEILLHTHDDGIVDTPVAADPILEFSSVTITNDGARWQVDDRFYVQTTAGRSSSVVVQQGGRLSISGQAVIALKGTGVLVIDDAGSLASVGGELTVGKQAGSIGQVIISDNGTLQSVDAVIGKDAGSNGHVTIQEGTWDICGDLQVGGDGHGELTVTDGLVEVCLDTTVGEDGVVTVNDDGEVVVWGDTLVNGSLIINNGGTVEALSTFNNTGTTNIKRGGKIVSPDATNSGTMLADGEDVGNFKNKELLIIGGQVTQIGRFNIDGSFEQYAAGALEVEINGYTPETEYDVLNVSGPVTLDGTLNVTALTDPLAFVAGDSFTVLTGGSTVVGTFDGISEGIQTSSSPLPTLSPGLRWDVSYQDGVTLYVVAQPEISIYDAYAYESDGTIQFDVELSASSSQPVTVDFATSDGSAIAGADYGVTTGSLTFAPGETYKTVSVNVTPDALDEDAEMLSLTLSNPSNATIADNQADGTIDDDDDPPVAQDDGTFLADYESTLQENVLGNDYDMDAAPSR